MNDLKVSPKFPRSKFFKTRRNLFQGNKGVLLKSCFSKLSLNFALFQHLDILEYLKNRLGRQFRNACNQHNPLLGAHLQFVHSYTHPKVSFQAHLSGKPEHIGHNLYMNYKS